MSEKDHTLSGAEKDDQSPSTTPETTSSVDVVKEEDANTTYPPRKVTVPAIAAIYLTVFLVALDRTILGTAIPAISNEFQSFGDIAWYEVGYLLPLAMLLLTFGRIYTYYPSKWVLVIQVAIFEIGSIICAVAPTSNALIAGRVISGIGSAGISSGGTIVINQIIPLQSRPKVVGGIGSMFGLASILGPILGGYLTAITWRWCFWINVPIGGVALAVLVLLSPNRPAPKQRAPTWSGKIMELDPLGFFLIAPTVTCLLVALQLGGIEWPWNNARVIALFVLTGVFGIAFVVSQIWRKEAATIPPRILRQRSVLSACIASLGIGSCLVIFPFYLPLWFQVIQGKSPQDSGLALIPLLLSIVVLVIGCGILTSTFGYYTPFSILGGMITVAGAALISTWKVDESKSMWIGYQILAGAGIGMSLQGPQIAVQTVLSQKDVAIGLSAIQFSNFVAGSIFVAVCQTLLGNRLVEKLVGIFPDINPAAVGSSGATTLRNMATPEQLPVVLEAYNDSIRAIWYVALGLACLSVVASCGLEWKSVKKNQPKDKVMTVEA